MEGATVTMVTTLEGGNDTASLFNNNQNANFGTWNLCACWSAFLIAIQLYLNRDVINSLLYSEAWKSSTNCARQQIYFQVPWNILQTSLLFCAAPIIYPYYWAAVHRFFQDSWVFWSILQWRWWGLGRTGVTMKDRPDRDGSLKQATRLYIFNPTGAKWKVKLCIS